jgi:nitrogen-specific signal transduction histidine kinase
MSKPNDMWGKLEEDFFLDVENGKSPMAVPLEKNEGEAPESKKNILPNKRVALNLFPFFIGMIDQFINTLKSLETHTRILPEKLSAKEFGTYLNRMITEDVKKIELLQNSLFSYIKINNPIIRTNTVNTLIEEELKKYRAELEEKKIRLLKTLEKDLPESAVPDDQLRYILSCVLQHVVTLMPQNGYFALFSRSITLQKESGEGLALRIKEEKFIEILIVYAGYKKPPEQFGTAVATPTRQKEEVLDLGLRLVDEIVQRNRGMMKFEVDEKKGKTGISLRFPVERRKVIYCQPAKELNPRINPSKTTFEKLSSLKEIKEGD